MEAAREDWVVDVAMRPMISVGISGWLEDDAEWGEGPTDCDGDSEFGEVWAPGAFCDGRVELDEGVGVGPAMPGMEVVGAIADDARALICADRRFRWCSCSAERW